MPLMRVSLMDWSAYQQLRQQVEAAATIEELRAAVIALLEHLNRIDYIGEPD